MSLKSRIGKLENQLGITTRQPDSKFCQCPGENKAIIPSLEHPGGIFDDTFEPYQEKTCLACSKPHDVRIVTLSAECWKDIELFYGDQVQL